MRHNIRCISMLMAVTLLAVALFRSIHLLQHSDLDSDHVDTQQHSILPPTSFQEGDRTYAYEHHPPAPAAVATTTTSSRTVLSNKNACNDTAVYYNIITEKYGVYSTSKPQPSVDAALQTSDTLWIIVNWISLPGKEKQYNYVLDRVNQKMSIHSNTTTTNNSTTFKLLITDSADLGSGFSQRGYALNKCIIQSSELLGSENVYLATRALVTGRNLGCFGTDKKKGRCIHRTLLGDINGTVLNYRNNSIARHIHGGVVAKWDFAVRTAYLPVFDKILLAKSHNNIMENASTILQPDYFDYEHVRTRDVAYIWNVTGDGMSCFRDRITTLIESMLSMHTNLTGVAHLVSERSRVGRTSTSESYADTLVSHKIVVVAQRDRWEDHLRLFEALSAGAMVLSDPITHPPAGLVNGKNIVFYNSLVDLWNKTLYYLNDERGIIERDKIARAGRELVLKHHEPHHRYERLMLGENWPKSLINPVAPLLLCTQSI